jgi:hypothetical protein
MSLEENSQHVETLQELKDLDVANMTPIEAINTLARLQERIDRSDSG